MIEHYSHKIQNAIQKELFKANSSIKIAVAWFTNDLLFQPLLLKLGAGVSVELILNKDDINCSGDNEVDFDEFVKAGGVLRWNDTKQLLHDKFCIIDDNVIIYGSYNWTNKAEYNEESIAISKGEDSTTTFYLEKFAKLSAKYPKEDKQVSVSNDNSMVVCFNDEAGTRKSRSVNINEFETKRIVPHHFVPFSKLHFYDDINVYRLYDKKALYVIAKCNNRFCFIDPSSFLPIDDILFTRFAQIRDYVDKDVNYLWLETNNKWGLYNTDSRKFVIPPRYDSYHLQTTNYDYFVVSINQKYGLVAKSGRVILDCEFEKIRIIDRDDNCIVIKNGNYGLFAHGQIDYDDKYKYYFSDGRYPIQINGKYGVYGYGAKIILDFVYDKIEYSSHSLGWGYPSGFHILIRDGKYGVHLCQDNRKTDCIYNSEDEIYNDIEKGYKIFF